MIRSLALLLVFFAPAVYSAEPEAEAGKPVKHTVEIHGQVPVAAPTAALTETALASRKAAASLAGSNAEKFVASDPAYKGLTIKLRDDSGVTNECPQGDGWVTVDLIIDADSPPRAVLKCSTFSGTIGCMTDADYANDPRYSNEDNHCSPNGSTQTLALPK